MANAVSSSLPYGAAPEKVQATLESFKGDVNAAVSYLIDEWEKDGRQLTCPYLPAPLGRRIEVSVPTTLGTSDLVVDLSHGCC